MTLHSLEIKTNIPCQYACPAGTSIPAYIRAIYHGDYNVAHDINLRDNFFPGILGRICTKPCEQACRHGLPELGESVSICQLKRYASDHKDKHHVFKRKTLKKTDKKVSIVGSGPAGLVVAHLLHHLGHEVTMYEKESTPGGMLTQAIPIFRLPPEICDEDINAILPANIKTYFNKTLGHDFTLDSLKANNDAVVIAIGCMNSRELAIEGSDLKGCVAGLDFVKQAKQGKIKNTGENILVIGGGFTAIDCARIAKRLGSKNVTMAIRRTIEDMSIAKEDLEDTLEENVKLLQLVSPVKITETDNKLCVTFTENEIVTDKNNRKRTARHIAGTEFSKHYGQVITAIGQVVDSSSFDPASLNSESHSSNNLSSLIYMTGDCATGASSVIDAIGHAKTMASQIDKDLMGEDRNKIKLIWHNDQNTTRKREWDFLKAVAPPKLEVDKRISWADAEVETGYNDALSLAESKRCYLCDLRYSIRSEDCIYCGLCIEECPQQCIEYIYRVKSSGFIGWIRRCLTKPVGIAIDSEPCIRCGLCLNACPVDCIDVTRLSMEVPD